MVVTTFVVIEDGVVAIGVVVPIIGVVVIPFIVIEVGAETIDVVDPIF